MLSLSELDYLTMPGLDVMLGHDDYPEGHQGGLTIVQNGARVAANGDLRLDRTPGQWQPVPRTGRRQVDRARQELTLHGEFPDPGPGRARLQPAALPRPPPPLRAERPGRRRGLPAPGGPRGAAPGGVGRQGRPEPRALPRRAPRPHLRHGRGGGPLPAPARRPGPPRCTGRGPARPARHRPPALGGPGVRPAADDRRARHPGPAGAPRRPRPAHQWLVRGPHPGAGRRHPGRDRVARLPPRPARLPGRAGPPALPGRLPPAPAQGGGGGAGRAGPRPARGGARAHRARRRAGGGARARAARVGAVPPLRLPPARLHRGARAGNVRAPVRQRPVGRLPHRAARSTEDRSGSRRWSTSCRCRCATCA